MEKHPVGALAAGTQGLAPSPWEAGTRLSTAAEVCTTLSPGRRR